MGIERKAFVGAMYSIDRYMEKNKELSRASLFSLLLAVSILFFAFHTVPVHAQKIADTALENLKTNVLPRTGVKDISYSVLIADVITTALSVTGVGFLILMVYAGIRWMTAEGDQEKVNTARRTIISASIGLAIIVGSYAITNLITQRLILGKKGSVDETQKENNAGGQPTVCCILRGGGSWSPGSAVYREKILTQEACLAESTQYGDPAFIFEKITTEKCNEAFECFDEYFVDKEQCIADLKLIPASGSATIPKASNENTSGGNSQQQPPAP